MSIARYFNPRLRVRLLQQEVIGWLERHPRAAYIRAAVMSAPTWADRDAIRALRNEARRLTVETGVRHVLDHVIPLTHPDVCGLTVSSNLRVITYAQNARKSNRWNPHQIELFSDGAGCALPLHPDNGSAGDLAGVRGAGAGAAG